MNLEFLLVGKPGRLDVVVTLSRRNLRALLVKIADPDSMKTITREIGPGVRLVLRGESDEMHYADRPPGQMTLWTEAGLQADLDVPGS